MSVSHIPGGKKYPHPTLPGHGCPLLSSCCQVLGQSDSTLPPDGRDLILHDMKCGKKWDFKQAVEIFAMHYG
jgi:hypothetical protein